MTEALLRRLYRRGRSAPQRRLVESAVGSPVVDGGHVRADRTSHSAEIRSLPPKFCECNR